MEGDPYTNLSARASGPLTVGDELSENSFSPDDAPLPIRRPEKSRNLDRARMTIQMSERPGCPA
jgi:hypothetical protein